MALTKKQIQYIIMYRGLGYNYEEIAEKVKTSSGTVGIYLRKLKRETEKDNVDETFWSYFSTDSLYDAAFKRGRK